MDINQAFKDSLKLQQKATAPRTFLLKVERDPMFSPNNPDVFKVIGTRTDTNERVAVVTVKANSQQYVPKAGDVMRADKAARDPANPAAPIYKAKFFHTYEQNGFCLQAVMQPLPIRETPGTAMIGANVLAYDPKSSGTSLTGADVIDKLSPAILKHLKQWEAEPSAITHDVQGRSVWGGKPTRGLVPLVVVRFAEQSFKIYGAGAMFNDPSDKLKGDRFPTDQELLQRIEGTSGIATLKNVIRSLIDAGATQEKLQQVDISVVPGVALAVGRDQLTNAQKKGKEYYPVPEAYVPKEGAGALAGHRDSFIHVKMTRTGKLAVVDTSPAPGGSASAMVPLFANEIARAEARQNMSAGAAAAPSQQSKMTREEALQQADFPATDFDPAPSQIQQQTPVQQQAPAQVHAHSNAAQSDNHFEDSDYDYASLDEDMTVIEGLSQGLDDGFDTLLQEAEAISASRHSPRMG